jgi:P-type Ca2+ transporter type 2C
MDSDVTSPQSDGAKTTVPWAEAFDAVVRNLDVDANEGLSPDEVEARLAQYGANSLKAAPRVHPLLKFLHQFQNPLVYLLLAAVCVSLIAWGFEGAHGAPVEAVAVFAIILVNAVLGFLQERKAEQAIAALQRLTSITATVLRNGHQQRVPAEGLVPGDVLIFAEGDAVAADARLISSTNLKVAEASLTGESVPVLKQTEPVQTDVSLGDRTNMVFKGTSVVTGVGRAIITTTGTHTEIGHIAHLLAETKEEPSPLERELERVGKALSIGVVVLAVLVVLVIVLTTQPRTPSDFVDILLLGVSLAVAAVPEGLPAVLSVVLAIGVQRMAREKAIVKKLSSVETLGSTSVICSDKTGTLTRNEMTLQRIVTLAGSVDVTGIGYEPNGELQRDARPLTDETHMREVEWVLRAASLANNAELSQVDGKWQFQGDPTEGALLVAAEKGGFGAAEQQKFKRVAEVPFDSDRKLMSCVVVNDTDGAILLLTKGAPDVLFARCSEQQAGTETQPLTDEGRAAIEREIASLSEQALRTLGVAYKRLSDTPKVEATGNADIERDLVFIGVVGLLDPPRPEAAAAIKQAADAGVRTIMITGDHPLTATKIAQQLGIAKEGAEAIAGSALSRMNEHDLQSAVKATSVFSRVAPEHKLKIVRALQAQGEIVAMTGDGVNDAPALKAANIGIAMGITGTEVSKEAARMILADDNFGTIIGAVREGRLIFNNISNALRYLLSSNIGEVLTVLIGVLAAPLLGLQTSTGQTIAPLLATQILWINLLTDAAPALALGVDNGIDDLMRRPPRALGTHIIDRRMQVDVLVSGLVMALSTLFVLDWSLPGGAFDGNHSEIHARTCAFTVLVLAQLFNCLNSRSESRSAFSHLVSNPRLWAAIGASTALQVLVVTLPFLNTAFGTTPLTSTDWLVCTLVASVTLWATEVRKWVWRR